ncbi:hypothetical protein [Methylobacterium sp. WL1]|uniref:hypothetical protein n=1 Tax=Methylobacterium sp. WL1 TaxID=2603276 RepID=UPI001FEF0656|nr:hypothetical protein [Methylobacterium sp. WL1]
MRNQAGRLSPPVTDTAVLARLPLPAADTVARYRTLLDGKRREHERAADRRDAAHSRCSTCDRLREREAGRPIATQSGSTPPVRPAMPPSRSCATPRGRAHRRARCDRGLRARPVRGRPPG